MEFAVLLQRLSAGGRVPVAESGLSRAQAAELGLGLTDDTLHWPAGCAPLDDAAIAHAFRAATKGAERSGEVLVHVFSAIGSTNDWLKERSVDQGIAGHLATAECQTAGRGRLGRRWSSPVGGSIALSFGLQVERPAEALGGLSLVAGLAALEALDPRGAMGLALKWPNDLVVGNAKLGGILTELVRVGPGAVDVVIGIGVNYRLREDVAAQIDRQVTDLHRLGERRDRSELVGGIAGQLQTFVPAFEREGFAPFRRAYELHHAFAARRVQLSGAGGDAQLAGRVAGVGPAGELLLETADGMRQVTAGELSLREA